MRRTQRRGAATRRLAWKLISSACLVCAGPAGGEAVDAPRAGGKVEPARAEDLKQIYSPTPVTRAVDRGLEYLRQSQLADGSWFSSASGGRGVSLGKNTGVISLAVLAMLSAGHEPGRGKYGETIERAVQFVLEQQWEGMIVKSREDSSHGPMYEHGISTLMLGQVIGMVKESGTGLEKIHRRHRDAVNLILRAQNLPRGDRPIDRFVLGGWRYYPGRPEADISVTGWQILALRAARDAGMSIPQVNIDQAVLYVKRCMQASGGFGYMPGPGQDPGIARTGTGILVLELCGEFQSPEAKRGGDWLLKRKLEWKGPFFYYSVYYANQAMYQLGGEYWEKWRPQSEEILLARQSPDGSWPPPPDETQEREAGLVYTTAMAILSFTVDYKYLPIYQR